MWTDEKLVNCYTISTARKGLGNRFGSHCTPTGKLKVAAKIGAGMPRGTVFRDRQATGQFWSSDPENPLFSAREDLVLTRVIWREGAEPTNANTRERMIYLHGTNREGLLGHPDSQGGIRFRNEDIEEVFNVLTEGCEVHIL